jgi:uncharacterized protein (TIGR02217 family)
MSYPIMTNFPLSMAKGLKKSPVFNTVVQKNAAGRGNSSFSLKPYPTWNFEFDMDSIAGNEAAATTVISGFLGLFMACAGSNGLFLFTDPQDYSVSYSNSCMADVSTSSTTPYALTGNGVSTKFQLARNFGGIVGATDFIQNLNGSITVKVNGTLTSASVSSTGVVTFSTAPANGATLQWAGNFYFLCRFDDDTIDATRIFTTNNGIDLWDFNSIKYSSEFV